MPGQFAPDFQGNSVPHHPHNPKNSHEKVIIFKNHRLRGGFLGNGLNLILALLLSRCLFPGELFPAGVAFGLINTGRQLKLVEKVIVLGGIFLGTLSIKGITVAGTVVGSLSIFYLIHGFCDRKKRTNLKGLISFFIWAVLRLSTTVIFDPTPYGCFITGIELILTYILTIFFRNGFNFLDNPLKAFSKLTLPALAIIIVLALGGTKDVVIQSLKLVDVLSILLLMIVSYLGGGGVGAAMGIVIALVLGMNTQNLVALIATYGTAGFIGGFLKDLGKWGTLFGACLGLAFIMQQQHFSLPETLTTLPWGIGMASFLLIPRRYLSQISNYFPNNSVNTHSSEEQKQMREIITSRLNDLAEIFTELAKSFNDNRQPQPDSEKMDLYSLLDQVCTKNCQHCNGYEVCWGENFYSTYREIFDLIAYAELYGEVSSKHLKGRLCKNCFQHFKLLATINQLFEKCQTDYIWQQKLDESKVFLANQLQGISSIISNLAVEVTTDSCFKSEVEEKIRHGLNRIGMLVNQVSVLSFDDQGLEIRIKQRNCNQRHECQYLAAAMISRLLEQEYTVWERSCHLENEVCSYCLTPARNYEMKTAVCKLPKDGNEFSGDNHALHELKNGNFISILSDGMGHGSKASLESNTTVSILEKLLATGIDRDFAVKMVNSVLLLHSPEESFATVDLAVINLYTARAEFIKIGAAGTYIKRGREVWSIQSTSLPAGILNTVDLERTVMELQPGDIIVMATDGIVDSRVNQPGKEEWMIRALRQVEVVGPEALGEYLLNLAKINQDGVPKDDMTVIVLQLLDCSFR